MSICNDVMITKQVRHVMDTLCRRNIYVVELTEQYGKSIELLHHLEAITLFSGNARCQDLSAISL